MKLPYICDIKRNATYTYLGVDSNQTAIKYLHNHYHDEGKRQTELENLTPNWDYQAVGKTWTINGYSGGGLYRLTYFDIFQPETMIPIEEAKK